MVFGKKISLPVFAILLLQSKTFLSGTTRMIYQLYQGIADNAAVHLVLW